MSTPRGDSEQTKAEILAAAQKLFAERGVLAVSVRDVAKAAGVTHGLVHHYFGTKEELAAKVIETALAASARYLIDNPIDTTPASADVMRRVLRHFLTEGRTAALLLARAELSGLQPEKMDLPGMGTSMRVMAQRFAQLQAVTLPQGTRVDPTMMAISVGAAVFGLIIMGPWLLSAVGLPPDDFESHIDEIIEIAVAFVGLSAGLFRPPCDGTPSSSGAEQIG